MEEYDQWDVLVNFRKKTHFGDPIYLQSICISHGGVSVKMWDTNKILIENLA